MDKIINSQDESLEINVALLREVQAAILKWPTHFDMEQPGRGCEFDPVVMAEPTCGTTACIAGWICMLGDKRSLVNYPYDILERAAELGGLTSTQADDLFWFHVDSDFIVTSQEAATAIDNFITSKGKSCYAAS
jgi:hypothetical protein